MVKKFLIVLAVLSMAVLSSCEVDEGHGSNRNRNNFGSVSDIHISNPLRGLVESISEADEEYNVPGRVMNTCLKYDGLSVMAEITCVDENLWSVTGEGSGVSFSVSGLSREAGIILDGETAYNWVVDGFEYEYRESPSLGMAVRSVSAAEFRWESKISWGGMYFGLELYGSFSAEFSVDGAVHDQLKIIYISGNWQTAML